MRTLIFSVDKYENWVWIQKLNAAIIHLNVMSYNCAYSTKETHMFTEEYLLPNQEMPMDVEGTFEKLTVEEN